MTPVPEKKVAVDTRCLVAISWFVMEMMMHETAQIAPRAEMALAVETKDEFVAPDELDDSSVTLMPAFSSKPTQATARVDAERLFAEGARGPWARSMLAKDIAIARVHARSLEVRLDFALRKLASGRSNERRVRLYADLLDRQNKRLLSSLDLLARLDAPLLPTVSVRADRAAVVVASEVRTQAG